MPQIYKFPFSVHQGSFLTPTVAGSYHISGLSFSPRLILFFGRMDRPINRGVVTNDCNSFLGAASYRNGIIAQWVTGHYQKDNNAGSLARGSNSQSFCLSLPESTTTFFCQASLSTVNADGFTLNFSDIDAFPREVYFFAIGGLTGDADVVCGTFTNTLGGGSQSITGLGFEPEALIFKHDFVSGTVHDDVGAAVNNPSSTPWCVSMFSQSGVSPSNAKEIFDNSRRCIMNWGNGATQAEYEVTSYDSDGFTINKIQQDAIQRPYNFIAIRGIEVASGSFFSASVGTLRRTITTGFPPFMIFCVGTGQSSTRTAMSQQDDVARSYGVARSGSNQMSYCYADSNGVATTQCASFYTEDYILSFLNHNTSQSIIQKGFVESLSSNGFVINHDVNDGNPRWCFYLALGGSSGSGRATRKRIEGMDIAPKEIHYMTIPHFSNEVAYSDWTVYIFKDGNRLTDVPYEIRENPLGTYTFSFANDGEDESQWTIIAYETAAPNDRYVEAWRVKSRVIENTVLSIQADQQNQKGGVGGSPGDSIGKS